MSKYKFGDRVKVAYPYWKIADEVGVVIGSSNGLNNIQFENGGYAGLVPDEFITPATDWVKCSERMPEYDSEVIVTDGNYVWRDKCYDFGDGLCFYDDNDSSATHWMPLPEIPEVKE